MVRRKLTLLVDDELIQRARSLGLNISRLTEKAIEETIVRLDSMRTHTYDNESLDLGENPQNELILPKEWWTGLASNCRLEPSTKRILSARSARTKLETSNK